MKVRAGLLAVLFLASVIPIANADEVAPVTINTDWVSEHAYTISGDVDLSEINITHLHGTESLDVGLIYDTTGQDLRVVANTSLSHGDVITINAGSVSRTVTVGVVGTTISRSRSYTEFTMGNGPRLG